MKNTAYLRFPTMLVAIVTLIVAMLYGLVRLGWQFSFIQPAMLIKHGPLLVSGFLGTLICVERAVALQKRAAYLPAIISALGAAGLFLNVPLPVSQILITVGSLGLVILFIIITLEHPALYTGTMTAGAVMWLVGNILWWAGLPIFQIVYWWMGFLILTIAGERLELSRVRKLSTASNVLFLIANLIFLGGSILAIFEFTIGSRVVGVGLLAIGVWLLRYDLATRTVRQSGLTRFIAICLLTGYSWLVLAGLMLMIVGGQAAGLWYDAILHGVFLGFVFAAIFGHAPLIFPAVLNVDIQYTPRFYAHLILLQLSLVIRIGSDMLAWPPGRMWGGMFNLIAILLFLVNTVSTAKRQSASA